MAEVEEAKIRAENLCKELDGKHYDSRMLKNKHLETENDSLRKQVKEQQQMITG